MTSEDDTQTRLRVGGWLPPYQAFPPGSDNRTSAHVNATISEVGVDTSVELSSFTKRDRRRSAALCCAAVAGLLLIGAALTHGGQRRAAPPAGSAVLLPTAPIVPVPPYGVFPTAATSPSGATAPSSPATRRPTTAVKQQLRPIGAPATTATRRPTATATRKPTRPPAPPTTRPPDPGLQAGVATSLELAGAPGYRVRHRDFRGRVDRIGPDSPALDRADSRFVVRRGLADWRCFSFESSNYPGRFLRHRDFELRLDRADGSRLFTEDATFCPQSRSQDSAVALRSHNYPDRYVTESRSLLRLNRADSATATRFFPRPPL
jgi:hypothetical protein